MVHPIKVPLFTPVVENENEAFLSSLPAIYLSPLFCNNDIAVIVPEAIDVAQNQDCNRRPLEATVTGTILKIISYFTIILPLLAILLNLIIRCNTRYQYAANVPEPQRVWEFRRSPEELEEIGLSFITAFDDLVNVSMDREFPNIC
jgi:hypothetical protein